MDESLKNINGWYMPREEKSLIKKIKSIQNKLKRYVAIDDYQAQLRIEAEKYVKEKKVAIDIGAHIGIWSVNLAKTFEQVHAFEINPDTQPCLELNIKERNIPNVTIYPIGLGEKETLVTITPTRRKSMGTAIMNRDEGTIPIKTLDSFGFERVDLIKIDVEGYESFVLLGAEETIKKCRPIIIMEDKGCHEQYNISSPSKVLERFGMIEIKRFRKDVIYGWP